MKKTIEMIGKTGRTILTKVSYGNARRVMIQYPDGTSEAHVYKYKVAKSAI